MAFLQGPVYEVTFFVDRDVVAEFDSWLEQYAPTSLDPEVTIDCRTIVIADADDGSDIRVCQHFLPSEEALDEFADGTGAAIEAEVAATFGDGVQISRRILREDTSYRTPGSEPAACLNCGQSLLGQYCGKCGQRARSRLISLWELVSDAFGDLFEIDSRLWQTLVPLVIRPGSLTHDYLQGRRARYMPPFRMYLVMSLIFFVVAFFDPREELGLLFEPDGGQAETSGGAEGLRLNLGDESGEDSDCNIDMADAEDMPGWLSRRLTPKRLQQVCERARLDDGRALLSNLVDNIPTALIVLLPLMAFVLKALYPLSRRYYVEHLLFLVHFHAFLFLILTLEIVYARFGALVSAPEAAVVLPIVATSFYVPVYLFVAMRRVYGQGRLVSFFKYSVLTLVYLVGLTVTMLSVLAIAAFSI